MDHRQRERYIASGLLAAFGLLAIAALVALTMYVDGQRQAAIERTEARLTEEVAHLHSELNLMNEALTQGLTQGFTQSRPEYCDQWGERFAQPEQCR
jgi:hypothetical protein